jgi:hypothetical protein
MQKGTKIMFDAISDNKDIWVRVISYSVVVSYNKNSDIK